MAELLLILKSVTTDVPLNEEGDKEDKEAKGSDIFDLAATLSKPLNLSASPHPRVCLNYQAENAF